VPDKRRERYYLDALRRALPEVPAGQPTEPEPPDFLFHTETDRLGVELTAFHLPPAEGEFAHQARQALKERIVEIADRLHHEAGGPALYVSVHFSHHASITKRDVQPMARAIAYAVLAAPAPLSISEPVELPWGSRPDFVWAIRIHPSVKGRDRLWHADAGGMVADIAPDHVSRVVLAKARNAPLARARCDRLWLVIVNDAFSHAAPAEITTAALEATYSGPFDRLIWLLPHVPKALDLRVRPAA
jgi:hypothetical protein